MKSHNKKESRKERKEKEEKEREEEKRKDEEREEKEQKEREEKERDEEEEKRKGYMENIRVYKKLNEDQKNIISECIIKKSGGLSVPMGRGKTLMSIILGLIQTDDNKRPILVVVSKTLITSWVNEISKWFGKKLKYVVFHSEFNRKIEQYELNDDIRLVITTSQVLSKAYKTYNIEQKFVEREIVNEGQFNQHEVLHYNPPKKPFIKITEGIGLLFGTKWGVLIVDEAQEYTNILKPICRSVVSICAKRRWCLSGTLFTNPVPERVLGYYMLINHKTFPNSLPETKKMLKNKDFEGYNKSLVLREDNLLDINVIEHIITTDFSEHEEKIYMHIKNIVIDVYKKVQIFKENHDTLNVRKFNAQLLALLIYLRQCIVTPLITISTLYIDLLNIDSDKKEILKDFMISLEKEEMIGYLNDTKNLKSTKIKKMMECTKGHKKIVIFSSFRTVINLLIYLFEKKDRKVLTLSGDMNVKKREKIINDFNESSDVILILTYSIGAEGLNLQSANTVMLLDYEWSYGTTAQAIARIVRQGQKSKDVDVYYFLSNTGVEKAIFNKQQEKLNVLKELSVGAMTSKVTKIKVKEIITILENDVNETAFKTLKAA